MTSKTDDIRFAVSVLLLCLFVILVHRPVAFAFDDVQLGCRKTVSKVTGSLAKTVGKVVAGCHKGRLKEKVGAANDCNDLSGAETDSKKKIVKARGKLVDKISGTKGKCSGLNLVAMGYEGCPVPCDVAVPAIVDAADLADCLICVVETEVTAMTAASLSNPSPPLGKADSKCHGTIAKGQTKHLGTILKERTKCQNSAERDGATDPLGCAGLDPSSKIASTRQKGESKIADKCGVASLVDVDSCATASTTDLNACVFGDSETKGETIFEAMYELSGAPPPPLLPTWTAVQTIFISAGCASVVCHGSAPGQGQMGNLGDYDLGYDELLVENVFCSGSAFTQRIVAGDDASSFLMAKLEGLHDCGSAMPFALPPLAPGQIELVRDWILDGAQKN